MSVENETISLLRLTTAGSVDDGKSTLIGRLLYDSKSILDDQLQAIKSDADDHIDLARLTDGLRAEREQGITIDVAYRYFASAKRRFIIADSPGHIEYTRNMVTAASTSDLALILVDARKGILQQTKRHIYLASLLGLPHLLVCVNKMDLVAFDQWRFEEIEAQVKSLVSFLNFSSVSIIPVSAYHGDNVVERSPNLRWHQGPTLIEYLDTIPLVDQHASHSGRFPIQYVIRGDRSNGSFEYSSESQSARRSSNDFARGYAGRVASGSFNIGDAVIVLPAGKHSRIKSITSYDADLETAFANDSAVITLEDDLDIGRGDILVLEGQPAYSSRRVRASICWMDDRPLNKKKTYVLKQSTQIVKAHVTRLIDYIDLEKVGHVGAEPEQTFGLNQIGTVELELSQPLVFDPYLKNRAMGSFILIDANTNATAAAGLLLAPCEEVEGRDQ